MLTVGEQLRLEGRRQAEAQVRADMLLRLMRKRFGSVTDEVEQRVRAAEPPVLDVWAEQIFDARTLEEVVAEPPMRSTVSGNKSKPKQKTASATTKSRSSLRATAPAE